MFNQGQSVRVFVDGQWFPGIIKSIRELPVPHYIVEYTNEKPEDESEEPGWDFFTDSELRHYNNHPS